MPRLILNPGMEGTQAFDLQPGTYEIGRRPDNAIRIPDPSVSGLHCRLALEGDRVTLTDLNSTNGTFVEGRQITETSLEHGHHLRFGNVDLLFQKNGPQPAPPPPVAGPQIRLAARAPSVPPVLSEAPAPPPVASSAAERPGGKARKKRKRAGKGRVYGEPKVGMGILGAAVGAFAGMLVWYGTIQLTGYEVGIIAWGVGIATGVGCRLLGGGYSQLLGFVAGAFTFIAIVGGQYLAGKAAVHEVFEEIADEYYEEAVTEAGAVVAMDSDAELRAYLLDESFYEEALDGVLTDSELETFRRDELPGLQALADRATTRHEFAEELRSEFFSAGMATLILAESLSLWTLLWLFLGIGSAWRLGIGEDAD